MPRQQRSCPNTKCQLYGHSEKGNIIRYDFFKLKRGKRRRYCCKICGRTFCSTTTTVYHRIHRSRNTFDEVCSLSVEGVSKSAIARVKRLSWNTVSRWLERAAHARWPHRLQEHLELLRCHYNFIRPHMALQFGTIRRTPAVQAGLTSKPLTFRQIFTSRVFVVFAIWVGIQSVLTQQRKAA